MSSEYDAHFEEEAAALIDTHGVQELIDDISGGSHTLVSVEVAPYVTRVLLANACVVRPLSMLASHATQLRTGVESVDALLGDGVPSGMLVEIYGAAGTGKTQLCMQLCTSSGGAIYCVTAGAFPARRFAQIASEDVQRRTVVETVRDVKELEDWASWRLEWLLRKTRAKIVVIDSIAALYRPAFARGSEIERAQSLTTTAAALKATTAKSGAALLCLNEVASRPGRQLIVPALGQSWARCCGTRLELTRTPGRLGTRRIRVKHSSFLPSGKEAYFSITAAGLSSANDF